MRYRVFHNASMVGPLVVLLIWLLDRKVCPLSTENFLHVCEWWFLTEVKGIPTQTFWLFLGVVFSHLSIIPIMNFVHLLVATIIVLSSPLKHQLAMLLVLLELHKHVQMCITCKVVALNEQAFQKNLTLTGQTFLTSTNALRWKSCFLLILNWNILSVTELFDTIHWGTRKNKSCLGPLICTTVQVMVWNYTYY